MEDDRSISPGQARAALDEVVRLRRRTRRERQAFWFPTLVFGMVVTASAWFYPPARLYEWPSGGAGASGWSRSLGLLGGQAAPRAWDAGWYWLIAVPAAYLLTAAYYMWRARRRGVVSTWRAWALSGFAVFAFVVLLVLRYWGHLAGDLTVRGLLPLVAIAVGFCVLAATQRSVEFGVFAAIFLGLALAANLYDMANLTERLGLSTDDAPYVNNVAAGVVLLAASAWFALRAQGWGVRVSFRVVRPAP